jgi:hypothetical protein
MDDSGHVIFLAFHARRAASLSRSASAQMPATLDVISNPPIGQEATVCIDGSNTSNKATHGISFQKGKTKAKQRYLKKKKDRRKHRKAVAPNRRADFGPNDDVMGEVDEQEEQEVVKEAIREEEARPRKRRRVTQVVEDIEIEPATASDLPPVPKARRSTPPPALPSFPLPALPNAPSKTDLALQGLDKNLVEAEIVDSATLLPISAEGDDDAGTGLTQRTRKRLMELGIKELFAGLFHPSPPPPLPQGHDEPHAVGHSSNGSGSFPSPP